MQEEAICLTPPPKKEEESILPKLAAVGACEHFTCRVPLNVCVCDTVCVCGCVCGRVCVCVFVYLFLFCLFVCFFEATPFGVVHTTTSIWRPTQIRYNERAHKLVNCIVRSLGHKQLVNY